MLTPFSPPFLWAIFLMCLTCNFVFVCFVVCIFNLHKLFCRVSFFLLFFSLSNMVFFGFVCLFVFWPHRTVCEILVPCPRIEPRPSAVRTRSLNHWTAREFPSTMFLRSIHETTATMLSMLLISSYFSPVYIYYILYIHSPATKYTAWTCRKCPLIELCKNFQGS